jgi:hypothetical protein
MTSIYQKLAVATAGAAMSFAVMEGNPAQAALLINSGSVVANLDSRETLFTIEFNQIPDFLQNDHLTTSNPNDFVLVSFCPLNENNLQLGLII